jgi:hypothetical protein
LITFWKVANAWGIDWGQKATYYHRRFSISVYPRIRGVTRYRKLNADTVKWWMICFSPKDEHKWYNFSAYFTIYPKK